MSNTTSPRAKSPRLDLNDVEMIFGTPNSPKPAKPDVHTVANEKPGKETVSVFCLFVKEAYRVGTYVNFNGDLSKFDTLERS